MPKVSVIVPSYNSGHFLKEALESALAQTFQDFEILVIDDGSTDQTKSIVEEYVKRYPDKIHYKYQENTGLPGARNTGLRQARGEYIALLDADDKWLEHRLAKTVAAIETDPRIGVAHANIARFDKDGQILDVPKRDAQYLSGWIFKYIFLRNAHVSCPTVLFKKKCCDTLGMFDENLAYLGCEDRELWLRIAKEYKFVYIDEVLAYYRITMNSMSKNMDKMMQARMYVVNKFCPKNGGNQRLRNKAIAKIHRDLADEFLSSQKFSESKREYLTALRHQPFSFWSWVNLMKALLKVKVRYA